VDLYQEDSALLFFVPIGVYSYSGSPEKPEIETNNNESITPVIIYNNAEIDKSQILLDNRKKAGIYMWTHKESGKLYIGSAFNLSLRISQYFSTPNLKKVDNYICRALLNHSHSAFSLTILEYIDVSNLSKEEARKLILSCEQYYLDLIFLEDDPNTYNILKEAGSSLGYKHTEEAISYFFNRKHSAETKALLSEIAKGRIISETTKAKMSEANKGEKNPMFGKTHTAETIAKMSKDKGITIYVYDNQGSLIYTFSSARKAAKFFNSYSTTILKFARNGGLFLDLWILSTSLINKD